MTHLHEHHQSLIRFCAKLTGNRHDAEDLVQDTYFRACKALAAGNYADEGKSLSWLFTIARNTFINNFRSRKARQVLDPSRIQTVTQNDALQNLAVEEILGSVARLSPGYSQPLLLRGEGYTYEETAERMNLKMGTLKSRINTGRGMLSAM
jgi:RNA polymerase sigma-70 factor (ECF subfamily)